MKKSEAAMLLTFVHSVQGGEVTDIGIAAWHDLLSDVDYSEAMVAARNHYKTESRRIWPADIRRAAPSTALDIRDGILYRNGKPVIGGPNGMTPDQYNEWLDRRSA